MVISELFEMFMIISFGIAWPTAILKSIKAKTSKGKSLIFMIVIFLGYIFGICSKFAGNTINYVTIFYIINLCMVGTDIVLYFVNLRYDRIREGNQVKKEQV